MNKTIVCASLLFTILSAGGALCTTESPSPGPAGCPPLSLAPLALPPGPEGLSYAHQIPAYGGELPVKLTFDSGSFPPGLAMSPAGQITGIPSASGTFDFTVTATDSCRSGVQRVSRSLRMVITDSGRSKVQPSVIKQQQLRLKVSVTPGAVSLLPGKPAEQEASYVIEAHPPQTATLYSPGGTFSVAGSVVEMVAAPLTIAVIKGAAKVSEKIVVPARALRAARQEKAKIIYSRPFSGRQATALAIVEFSLDQQEEKLR